VLAAFAETGRATLKQIRPSPIRTKPGAGFCTLNLVLGCHQGDQAYTDPSQADEH